MPNPPKLLKTHRITGVSPKTMPQFQDTFNIFEIQPDLPAVLFNALSAVVPKALPYAAKDTTFKSVL
ncbi:hypothetical protein H6F75_12835 [Nodosilinea sp. FACHB-131]|uniref:hypothetical protein n=1 Tax=Cyanophyceae TaxID=3028117 RepID=UPI001683ABFC|nr:hypothetical protein [Nodosilinea sp. FACHB-131]MBD1874371.1 hypothetical protein [Nodosilinea sp. FACHB-131]